jgi:pilus assembly protein CpaD
MTQHSLLFACAGLGLLLAACSTDDVAAPMAPPKEFKVSYTELEHRTDFVHAGASFAPGAAAKLDAFLGSAGVTSDDHVYLEPARGDRLAAQRIGRISHELAQHGIGARVLPAVDTGVGADQLLIKVERYVVTPPNCPDWTKSPLYGQHDNQVASNFGCATTTNLGLMVADPRDLTVGRVMGPEEGDPAIAAIARYRDGKPKPLPGGSGGGSGYSPVTIQMPGSGGGGNGQ